MCDQVVVALAGDLEDAAGESCGDHRTFKSSTMFDLIEHTYSQSSPLFKQEDRTLDFCFRHRFVVFMILLQPHVARAARAMLGVSQRELADLAGVAPGTVVSLEKGGMVTHESEERVTRYLRKCGIVLLGEPGEPLDGLRLSSPPELGPRRRGRRKPLGQVSEDST